MQILIQNPATKSFFDGKGDWTPFLEHGQDFESFEEAMAVCRKHQLEDYQLILKFYHPNFETILSREDAERLAGNAISTRLHSMAQ